jgi:hypothetical protein
MGPPENTGLLSAPETVKPLPPGATAKKREGSAQHFARAFEGTLLVTPIFIILL